MKNYGGKNYEMYVLVIETASLSPKPNETHIVTGQIFGVSKWF